MRKPFDTIFVKTVIDGEQKKVFIKNFLNKIKLLSEIRGYSFAPVEEKKVISGGGGGVIFNPPPAVTPVNPTVSGVFELNPDLRQLQGSYTDATKVEVVMKSEGNIVFTALTTLSNGAWSLDLSPYTFELQKGYEATITASNNTGANPVSIVLTDTYAPPILSVNWVVEEPLSLTGTYSNADYIDILITDANGLTVSQGQALLETTGPNWEYNVSDLQLLDGMDYKVEATAHNADGDTVAIAQQTYIAPPAEYVEFLKDPNLTLFGQYAYFTEDTLSTNWESEAYPYNYAYVADNGENTYDLGAETTITLGRFIHPDEADTFQLLISKYEGGTLKLGYDLASYNNYFFGYFGDGGDGSAASALIAGAQLAQKGVWEHYAVKFERSTKTVTYYQNGIRVGSKVLGAEMPPEDSSLTTVVGVKSGTNQGAISPFRARWRDIRFYKRLLTDEEVLQVNNELDRS